MKLVVEKPENSSDFEKLCQNAGAPLPWSLELGQLLAADGTVIARLDPGYVLTNVEAFNLASAIMIAVHTCGGFKATVTP